LPSTTFVTGGAGFIGSAPVRRLIAGSDVVERDAFRFDDHCDAIRTVLRRARPDR
jgi:nucleoside-diphosphate-sugar epimerase